MQLLCFRGRCGQKLISDSAQFTSGQLCHMLRIISYQHIIIIQQTSMSQNSQKIRTHWTSKNHLATSNPFKNSMLSAIIGVIINSIITALLTHNICTMIGLVTAGMTTVKFGKPTKIPEQLTSSYFREPCAGNSDLWLSRLDSVCRHRAKATSI